MNANAAVSSYSADLGFFFLLFFLFVFFILGNSIISFSNESFLLGGFFVGARSLGVDTRFVSIWYHLLYKSNPFPRSWQSRHVWTM